MERAEESAEEGMAILVGDAPQLVVVDGSSFCLSAPSGDFTVLGQGFFVDDLCHLSRLRLTVDGGPLQTLSAGQASHFRAESYLLPLKEEPHAPQERLVVRRRQVAGPTFVDEILLRNEGQEPWPARLELELAADFRAAAKLGSGTRPDLPPERAPEARGTISELTIAEEGGSARTRVSLSEPAEADAGRLRLSLVVPARGERALTLTVSAEGEGEHLPFAAALARAERDLERFRREAPRLEAPYCPTLALAFRRSLSDLAALRFYDPRSKAPLLAAGLPWFMTVFGRDSLLSCLESMILGPDLATATLQMLALLQAEEDDPEIEAEPGKIIHELRRGRAAERWFSVYYATADATPLFLVLLAELYRWGGEEALLHELKPQALKALGWCDRYGDRDGDGFVEFFKRRQGKGLEVHTWKDSRRSQMFKDGRLAQAPLAAAEVQGYVYAAKRGLAEVSRAVWGDEELALKLEREAATLKRRFDEAFWLAEGYYAMALDRDKRPVDALASNIGHLLWSGIVPDERVEQLVAQLVGPRLFSGWGVRTMAAGEGGYNPLVYHNGCVWPHDTALAVWGLKRYGRDDEALLLSLALLEAASFSGGQLPELFAGFSRAEAPFPVAYPATCRPQAWAAAVPLLLARTLVGLEPEPQTATLRAGRAPIELEGLRLRGVRAFGRRFSVAVDDGQATVSDDG